MDRERQSAGVAALTTAASSPVKTARINDSMLIFDQFRTRFFFKKKKKMSSIELLNLSFF